MDDVDTISLLIKSPSLTPTLDDYWLSGHWASIDEKSMQGHLNRLSNNREFAKELGIRGQRYVLSHFNQERVALQYAHRIRTLHHLLKTQQRGISTVYNSSGVEAFLLQNNGTNFDPGIVNNELWSMSGMGV